MQIEHLTAERDQLKHELLVAQQKLQKSRAHATDSAVTKFVDSSASSAATTSQANPCHSGRVTDLEQRIRVRIFLLLNIPSPHKCCVCLDPKTLLLEVA
jgi:hypothetical protein